MGPTSLGAAEEVTETQADSQALLPELRQIMDLCGLPADMRLECHAPGHFAIGDQDVHYRVVHAHGVCCENYAAINHLTSHLSRDRKSVV